MLSMSSISGVGMVGADVCGFGYNTTETLCARWAWLGAFNTFYRNHVDIESNSHEFYRWPITADAARRAGKTRLQLLDYTYTALRRHSVNGTPVIWPTSWIHPSPDTVKMESQFYYGPSLLVAPVLAENATQSDVWLAPNTTFYDFFTLKATQGNGWLHLPQVGYETIPVYVRAGAVVPLRKGDAMTTVENAKLPFEIRVFPDAQGKASGELYVDDGISLEPKGFADLQFTFNGGKLRISGNCGYPVRIASVVVAGQKQKRNCNVNGQAKPADFNAQSGTLTVNVDLNVDREMTIELK